MTPHIEQKWALHYLIIEAYPEAGCSWCYDRHWVPVSVETFLDCYAARVAAGMEVNIIQKVEECSVPVGHCTCRKEPAC